MLDNIKLKLVLAIGGPTASGKSGLALAVAEEFNGIVINFDSMQVYNGLPILTAQPSAEELERVEHSLYSVLDPREVCSAMLWKDLALREINRAHQQGKLPILVGGTGFYLNTLQRGLSPIPEVPQEIRALLTKKHQAMGTADFFAEFSLLDPIMAKKIDPYNPQRIIRAWEVLEFTGKSIAFWQDEPLIAPPKELLFKNITIIPQRADLYAVCNLRFNEMLKMGALQEVEEFRAKYTDNIALNNALGYKELCAYMDGIINYEDAVTKAQQITRNYAKRQVTWFKNQIKADLQIANPKDSLENIKQKLREEGF